MNLPPHTKQAAQDIEATAESIERLKLIAGIVTDTLVGPLYFDPVRALCIIGQIQLASRHPSNQGYALTVAKEFAVELEEMLVKENPHVRALIRAGWDPRYDVSASPAPGADEPPLK